MQRSSCSAACGTSRRQASSSASPAACSATRGAASDSTRPPACSPTRSLIDQVLETLAMERPPEPDTPVLAKMVSTPIGGRRRHRGGRMEAIRDQADAVDVGANTRRPRATVHPRHRRRACCAPGRAPRRCHHRWGGATALRGLGGPRVATQPILDAVLAFLQALTPAQRERASFAMDAIEWRMWINVHMNHFRHGVMLEDLPQPVRDLALDILRATLVGSRLSPGPLDHAHQRAHRRADR